MTAPWLWLRNHFSLFFLPRFFPQKKDRFIKAIPAFKPIQGELIAHKGESPEKIYQFSDDAEVFDIKAQREKVCSSNPAQTSILLEHYVPGDRYGYIYHPKRTQTPNMVTYSSLRGHHFFGKIAATVNVPGYKVLQNKMHDSLPQGHLSIPNGDTFGFILYLWFLWKCHFLWDNGLWQSHVHVS